MPDEDAPRSQGVYYAAQDYAGFWRRVCVAAIDLLLVALVTGLVASAVPAGWLLQSAGPDLLFFLILFAYATALKGSRLSSVGYRIGRVEIKTLRGERASPLLLGLRLLAIMLPPLLIVDYLWIMHDPHRQTLHDKLAGTYVIKTGAKPIGQGRLVDVALDVNCFFLVRSGSQGI